MDSYEVTQSKIDFFHENGYVFFNDIIDRKTINELIDHIEGLLTGKYDSSEFHAGPASTQTDKDIGKYILQVTPAGFNKGVKRIEDPALNKISKHPVINSIAKQLLNIPEVGIFQQQALIKDPGFENNTPWHQDDFYWRSEQTAITCWTPLQECNIENGTMYLYPKSHKLGVLEHIKAKGDSLFHVVKKPLNESNFIPVDIELGGVSFHHAQTIHGSFINNGNQRRIALAQHYSKPKSWFGWNSIGAELNPLIPKKQFIKTQNISSSSVNRWMKNGSLHYVKKPNGRVFFRRKQIARFINNHW